MERAKALIDKLIEQSKDNASPQAMMVTAQLLQAELAKLTTQNGSQSGTSKVSVVLPYISQRSTSTNGAEATKKMEAPTPSSSKEVWMLDPIFETPTLAHQDQVKELNEKMSQLNKESLNEKLKTERIEISSLHAETPLKDLKKAIGINDRFTFLNELFRGDEDMYERSIKTINNFRILPEAEYWIERELKVKIGWDENSETVRHFNQLVKRRFS